MNAVLRLYPNSPNPDHTIILNYKAKTGEGDTTSLEKPQKSATTYL